MKEFEYWENELAEIDPGMDRRRFLKTAGTGIFLFFNIKDLSVLTQEGTGRPVVQGGPSDFNAYMRIGEDGRVTEEQPDQCEQEEAQAVGRRGGGVTQGRVRHLRAG